MLRFLPIPLVILLLSGCAAPTKTDSGLTLVSHRGGANVHPENSMEAFQASAEGGFPVEMDLRQLADGTIVAIHNENANETMSGIAGPVNTIDSTQWNAANVTTKSGKGTPATWQEILDTHGADATLAPELKSKEIDLESFAQTITRRGIEETVIVQTPSFASAKELTAHGVQALYLLSSGQEPATVPIKETGINYVGVPATVNAEYLADLEEAGLTVWVYTVNDADEARELERLGADGVFTDDPWALRKALK